MRFTESFCRLFIKSAVNITHGFHFIEAVINLVVEPFKGVDAFDVLLHFFSILLTHEGSHREAYRDFQPSLTSSAGGVKG